jgi:hypothetical protein
MNPATSFREERLRPLLSWLHYEGFPERLAGEQVAFEGVDRCRGRRAFVRGN